MTEFEVRHARTGGVNGSTPPASFDVSIVHEGASYFRGTLVALSADEERALSARLLAAFPGAVYGAGATGDAGAALDREFGYGATPSSGEGVAV